MKKVAFILALILIWQALASLGFYNQILLPPPVEIGKALVGMTRSGSLLIDILMSLKRMMTGFAIACLLGTTLAILLVLSKPIADYTSTVLELIRPIPPIAWIPIAILWFG